MTLLCFAGDVPDVEDVDALDEPSGPLDSDGVWDNEAAELEVLGSAAVGTVAFALWSLVVASAAQAVALVALVVPPGNWLFHFCCCWNA